MKPASTTRSGAVRIDGRGQRVVEGLARGEGLVLDHRGGDAVRAGELQAARIGAVADHRRHARRPALGGTALHDGFHVGAAAGDQDDDRFIAGSVTMGRP